MKEIQITFPSSNGVHVLSGLVWLPTKDPVGIIQIIHGMADRIRRFSETAEYFTKKGFIVCGYDQIGHGDSINDKNPQGFIPFENGYLNLINDAVLFNKLIIENYPNLPYSLIGFSMGAEVAKLMSIHEDAKIDNLILIGSKLKTKLLFLAIAITKKSLKKEGEMAKAEKVDKLAFKNINKRFEPKRTVSDWLSRDIDRVDSFVNDPKCCFLFSNRGYLNILYLIKESSKMVNLSKINKNMPILICSGLEDVSNKLGQGSKALYKKLLKLGKKDVMLKLYPDTRHDLLNEINRHDIFADIYNWLLK